MEPEKNHPGVSGKERGGKRWINPDAREKQKEFADEMYEVDEGYEPQGRGNNLFGRTDLTNQEGHEETSLDQQKVVVALKRSPEVDISDIEIKVDGGTVILEGTVDHPSRVRTVENLVWSVSGVKKIINHLEPREGERL